MTVLLLRHASHDLLGRTLAGRAPDLHINDKGKAEAERLADRLASIPIQAIYTSPLERTQETAWPIAGKLSLPLTVHAGFNEVDCGNWTGKDFADLNPDPEWQRWNSERGSARIPGGESMQEVQDRVVRTLGELYAKHRDGHIAVMSHGDVIKAALMHYMGIPLDCILRFEISPASVSMVTVYDWGAHVTLVNHTGELAA